MSNPYVGEIRLFAGTFAPQGWLFCDGSLLPIAENEVLYQLIGTTYGGDGQNTFALPNLLGRLPIHQGNGGAAGTYVLGQSSGSESVTLNSVNQIPSHNHPMVASTGAPSTTPSAANQVLASPTGISFYSDATPATALAQNAIGPSPGQAQPHSNLQPYLCVNFIISLFGIYPSQN